jgi:single-stranded-DNA-specific exonuclease
MKTRWKHILTDDKKVNDLQNELKIHPLLCKLLVQRNLTEPEFIQRFFNPDLENLHDPFLMRGMASAVSRVRQAINQGERILLYGDYDVDGTTSIALLFSFLKKYHSKLDYYIPDRYKEGYGVSYEGIDYASQNDVSLIISLDCGIKAVGQIGEAGKRNIDFIIMDHHLPGPELPKALAILDPKQASCDYPYKELSGCGIAFKFVQAFSQHQKIWEDEVYALLDLVVVSIASDIVPMNGENRILSYYGLKKLNRNPRLGLLALIKQGGRNNPLTISDIVYGIGPMINAAGRMADARQAVKLLLTEEKAVAEDYALQLERQNNQRKEFDKKIIQEAEILIDELVDLEKQKSIVLFQPHWHKGVVGIAASRIVEKYNRPAIILTESNGEIVGSARSVSGFDIYKAIKSCDDLLLRFGGHKHAAGLSLSVEKLKLFSDRFENIAKESAILETKEPEILISAELDLEDLTLSFWKKLKQFAPFGPKNRNPVFVSQNVEDTGYSKLLKNNHLRLSVRQKRSAVFYGIAFGQGNAFEQIKENHFHICYNLQENHWEGKTSIQLQVKDIKFGGL